jgi:hypothetical protein
MLGDRFIQRILAASGNVDEGALFNQSLRSAEAKTCRSAGGASYSSLQLLCAHDLSFSGNA